MKRYISSAAAVALLLSSALLVGCETPASPSATASREYTPNAKPTQLAAYAASTPYPANLQAQENPDLVVLVGKEPGSLTLINTGKQPLRDFNVWINRAYLLHVDRIDPNSVRYLNTSDFYNSAGNNISGAAADSNRQVQVQTADGILYNVKGPVVL